MAEITQLNKEISNATVLNPDVVAGNTTVINQDVINANETVLNKEIVNSNATVLNSQLTSDSGLQAGDILCDSYKIEEKLSIATGEADLYRCSKDNSDYIAKVYRREVSIKPEIIAQLRSMYSPYVARVIEMGTYNGCDVEIQPYYKNGSLSGKRFSLQELKNNIIPCLNEGLKVLHDNNIIHKDLKPSNIMLADNGRDVVIIDFGISSVKDDDSTVLVTKTGMTPEYSAPEAFRNLFLDISDYYSLGITIFELFCGNTPYGDMPKEDVEKYVTIQKIPFPDDMPKELADLISALTYIDIANRDNKDNPNRRWGYTEVLNWLNGVKQTLPGEGLGAKEIRPYNFMGKEYKDKIELIRAMAVNWEQGKKELFRGNLSDYFRRFDPNAERICLDAEKEIENGYGKDDLIFFKVLYRLNRKTRDFYWKGKVYEGGLTALGMDLQEHLWNANKSMNIFMDGILNDGVLSAYVSMIDPKNEKRIKVMHSLEQSYRVHEKQRHEQEKDMFYTGFVLSRRKILKLSDREFYTISELRNYMTELLDVSLDTFKNFCHNLVDYDNNLLPQLECWLIVMGKKEELEKWKESFSSTGR